MKIYEKSWRTKIPGSMEEVWDFFSDPTNLQKITPKDMNFEVLSDLRNISMYSGMLIRYKVSPIASIRMNWVTEITSLQPHSYFIDEQRFGPYSLWHHEHRFEETGDGILMTDILHYGIPLGIVGQMMNRIMISRRIDHIFDYRQDMIEVLFQPQKSVLKSIS